MVFISNSPGWTHKSRPPELFRRSGEIKKPRRLGKGVLAAQRPAPLRLPGDGGTTSQDWGFASPLWPQGSAGVTGSV